MDDVQRQWLTLALMVAVALFIIASDVWLMKTFGVHATYSRVAARLFADYPVTFVVAVFALGTLVGHILLPTHSR
ncbi:MAG: hypothetical protein P4L67_04985 [Candidatus Pacebacteria bacterium]|nr:hypothetical protein [Candidatus Paceibacterota bacterium]